MSGVVERIGVERVVGAAIAEYIPALAALRISVFREWPYLYAGSLEYEETYLATYAASPNGMIVIARDGARVVGASTALPLAQHSDNVVPPLIAAGYAPETVCYFGESVLEGPYRGRGLGHAFFEHREAHARTHGLTVAAFCAVERSAEHPARPADYRDLEPLWTSHGFVKRPDVVTTFAWRDVGDDAETPKRMVFWIKELR